jgi:hypothetical protein
MDGVNIDFRPLLVGVFGEPKEIRGVYSKDIPRRESLLSERNQL